MNREIKFRAWFDNGKSQDMFFVGDAYGTTHPLDCCRYAQDGQPVTLMQFTGLKDSNGVEVYEGDVVEFFCEFTEETSNHQVKYFCNDDYPAFDFSPSISDDMNGFSALVYQDVGTIKVIGNIYQNPELLNDTKSK